MAKGKVSAAALVLCVLQLCGAMKLQCTVTQEGHQWIYSLSHVAEVTSDPSSYDYSYQDGNNVELANQDDSIGTVIRHSVNTLVTAECIPTVHFTAAKSKGMIETEYTSTCSILCSVSALSSVTAPQSQKNETAPSSSHESTGPGWAGTGTKIALGVLIPILILILVLVALFFLWPKFGDGIRRKCRCNQGQDYNMGVKIDNTGAKVVKV